MDFLEIEQLKKIRVKNQGLLNKAIQELECNAEYSIDQAMAIRNIDYKDLEEETGLSVKVLERGSRDTKRKISKALGLRIK